MTRRHGLTLVELLLVIAIITLLVAIFVPVIGSALRERGMTGCQANLKSIGTAFLEHGRANNGLFPRLNTQADLIPVAYVASDTLADISPHAMNTVWIMIADGRVPSTGFKCPGHTYYERRVANSRYGWTRNDEFSYGIQYLSDMHQKTDGSATAAFNEANPADKYNSNMILMADKNPTEVAHDAPTGEPAAGVGRTLDHSNHAGEGLTYLTKSGNFAFLDDEDGSIVDDDEIYTSDRQDANDIGPDAADDVMIVADPA